MFGMTIAEGLLCIQSRYRVIHSISHHSHSAIFDDSNLSCWAPSKDRSRIRLDAVAGSGDSCLDQQAASRDCVGRTGRDARPEQFHRSPRSRAGGLRTETISAVWISVSTGRVGVPSKRRRCVRWGEGSGRVGGGRSASGRLSRIADWPHLFGYIATSTGWTIPEIELLTLRQANELLEYWSEHPPQHVLLAAMMRARPLRKNRGSGDLLTAVASAGGPVSSSPPEPIKNLLQHHAANANAKPSAGGTKCESPGQSPG